MRKKILITISIFLVILYGCASQNVKFPKVDVKESHKTCVSNYDCTTVSTDCAGCVCSEPVNKDYKDLYFSKRIKLCKRYRGPVCSILCDKIVRCVQGICQAIPFNASESDSLEILQLEMHVARQHESKGVGAYYSSTGSDFSVDLDCGEGACENLDFGSFKAKVGETTKFPFKIPPHYTKDKQTRCMLNVREGGVVKETKELILILRDAEEYGELEIPYSEDSCIKGVAGVNNNPELCYRIGDESEIDSCIESVAVVSEDPKLCYRIEDATERDSCLSGVASRAKNFTICGEIKVSAIKSMCYIVVELRLKSKDPKVCYVIEDTKGRDSCLSEVASRAKNATICEEIKTPYYKKECHSRLRTT